jgi:hypothetical protein
MSLKPRVPLRIGLDIDGTISTHPEFFANLSQEVKCSNGWIAIITSRFDQGNNRVGTIRELEGWSIHYNQLHMFRPYDEILELCPFQELSWQERYLWQKVHYACIERLDTHYDDDEDVLKLFRKYLHHVDVIDAKLL